MRPSKYASIGFCPRGRRRGSDRRRRLSAPRLSSLQASTTSEASALPTTASGRYLIAGGWATPGTMLRVGNTVYVGGAFSQIANRTGSAIVVPGSGGAPEPGFPEVAGGSVTASVADGAGGWYLGGSFTNVGGVARPGLAHVRGDERARYGLRSGRARGRSGARSRREGALRRRRSARHVFRPRAERPRRHDGRRPPDQLRRAGGCKEPGRSRRERGSPIRRLRPTISTRAWSPSMPPPAARIWVHSFGFDGLPRGHGDARPRRRPELLVGGEFGDAGNENLEALDVFDRNAHRADLQGVDRGHLDRRRRRTRSTSPDTAHKRGSSGLDVIDSTTGLERSWGLIRAEQLAANGSTLYVAGTTAADERQGVHARVYSARTGTAKAVLHAGLTAARRHRADAGTTERSSPRRRNVRGRGRSRTREPRRFRRPHREAAAVASERRTAW